MATPKKEAPKRGNGSGGKPRKVRDGLYRAEASLGFDRDGKRIRRTVYGRNPTEVDRKVRELLTDHGRGKIADPSAITLGDWLDTWLARKQGTVTDSTHELYRGTLERHVKPDPIARERLQALRRSHVKDFVKRLMLKPLSRSYRAKALMYLKAAIAEAVGDEILHVDPTLHVELPSLVRDTMPARETGALTEGEMLRFLDVARGDPMYHLLYTLFSLGLRRGEGLGLRWIDLDFDAGNVRIAQQVRRGRVDGRWAPVLSAPKTLSSADVVPMSADLAAVLEERRTVQAADREALGDAWTETGLVFTTTLGTLIQPDNVNRTIERLRKRAGVRHFASHACRKTMISLCLAGGAQLEVVSKLARHARPSITADLYRTVYEDEKRAAAFSIAARQARQVRPEA